MYDQAAKLRSRVENNGEGSKTRTIAVMSGKGGVGKSNISLNMALTLSGNGYKVLLIDMDIGMGNIDILMGTSPPYTIADFFQNNVGLERIIVSGPQSLHYIAGGTGLSHFIDFDPMHMSRFMDEFQQLLYQYDFVFFDMGAGISEHSSKFILSAEDIIVVTTTEPPSITDAYAAVKHVKLLNDRIPFHFIVNRVQNEKEGKETFQRINGALKKFLGIETAFLGSIPDDQNISMAVKRQIPLVLYNDRSPAAKGIKQVADLLIKPIDDIQSMKKKTNFVANLRRLLFER
ncbi:MinD/ParA family protein [Cytobacillus gottheilii]|uniref:MinD/ParA family protein n=1 Tax=Cytobacillus gottheilii TaxID=859144 RepID=A0ABX8FH36_9BACI|nr:MinD/ParA family protein [Cytobacillus gottheilii]QVY63308.1 MinD/ParA family protein [Cytobacillus gottheilii]